MGTDGGAPSPSSPEPADASAVASAVAIARLAEAHACELHVPPADGAADGVLEMEKSAMTLANDETSAMGWMRVQTRTMHTHAITWKYSSFIDAVVMVSKPFLSVYYKKMSSAPSLVQLDDARLKELASRPNTVVYGETHDSTHDPWSAQRLRDVAERLARKVGEIGEEVDNFRLRKRCMADDEEIAAFQEAHPRLFWLLTDREVLSDGRARSAMAAMLHVRAMVERGDVRAGTDADLMAAQGILEAFGGAPKE